MLFRSKLASATFFAAEANFRLDRIIAAARSVPASDYFERLAIDRAVDQIAAANKQAQIKSNTEVTGAAVESLNGPDATALVYTNTTSTSPATKDIPSLKYLSYRLTLKRDHARWLVTKMTTITSLDLTPQF